LSFAFKTRETVRQGARRIVRAQIGRILADLGGGRRMGREKALHETRKGIKRLRALLRMLHGSMDRKVFDRENAALRETGRALSAARDATALVEAFDEILDRIDGSGSARSHQPARAGLLARRRAALREQRLRGVKGILRSLRAVRRRLLEARIKGKDFLALRGGLKRIFRQGREAFEVVLFDRGDLELHEWRKRVKDLLHHAELLEPIWPEVLRTFREKLHALSDCLGEDHDLAVLRQVLSGDGEPFGAPETLDDLLAAIDLRRRELQQAAVQLGERIYGERPGAFIERMGNYWNAWREGALRIITRC
jgi:CHAD domain-containing protein